MIARRKKTFYFLSQCEDNPFRVCRAEIKKETQMRCVPVPLVNKLLLLLAVHM